MQSLRDKLLKAGVVTAEQAQQSKAKEEADRQKKRDRAHKPAPAPPVRVERVESEKDRERRLNREMAERQKQIRAICDASEVSDRGEQAFFYRTRRGQLRRLYLTPAQVESLQKGDLAIVDRPNGQDRPHALVPRATADEVLKLEVKAIRFWARAPGESYGFEDEPASAEEQASAGVASAADQEAAPPPEPETPSSGS